MWGSKRDASLSELTAQLTGFFVHWESDNVIGELENSFKVPWIYYTASSFFFMLSKPFWLTVAVFWLVEESYSDSRKSASSPFPDPVAEVSLWLTPWLWSTGDPLTLNEGSIGQSWPSRIDSDMISLKLGTPSEYISPSSALNTMAAIKWPCSSEPIEEKIPEENPLSTWLKFLQRSCTEIWSDPQWQSNYRNSDAEDKTSRLLSLSASESIHLSHVNYDKWLWGGMCLLQQAFSFPFWGIPLIDMLYLISINHWGCLLSE